MKKGPPVAARSISKSQKRMKPATATAKRKEKTLNLFAQDTASERVSAGFELNDFLFWKVAIAHSEEGFNTQILSY